MGIPVPFKSTTVQNKVQKQSEIDYQKNKNQIDKGPEPIVQKAVEYLLNVGYRTAAQEKEFNDSQEAARKKQQSEDVARTTEYNSQKYYAQGFNALVSNAIQAVGHVPFTNNAGPLNDPQPPLTKTDFIATGHDKKYGEAYYNYEVKQADNEFQKDATNIIVDSNSNTLDVAQAAAGKVGVGAKQLVEKIVGKPIYPSNLSGKQWLLQNIFTETSLVTRRIKNA